MSRNGFVGRKTELERLNRCLESRQAQLVVLYGRRRVGKTFLVESFFENYIDFSFTGAYEQPRSVQLKNFAEELRFQAGMDRAVPETWRDAFVLLREYISTFDHERKHVVFFDEMPWMDTHKSDFLSSFEWFWNSWGSKQNNLIMVVCGSATSWMVKKIVDNKGGLYNRQTCRICLEPFTLHETELFLKERNMNWSRIEIAECYMIMGGMPYYLNLLDSAKSFRQNIDHLFFRKRGELWDEYYHLYHTLFSDGETYSRVVEVLSVRPMGYTRKELQEKTGIRSSGVFSKILEDLTVSGFVRISAFYGNKKKQALYQLCDYYSMFYLRFIKSNYAMDEAFWSTSFDNPAQRAWRGLMFEQLCKDHIREIKRALSIGGVSTEESTWFARPDADHPELARGGQIDLLIDRRDKCINICEMKFSMNEYEITKDEEAVLRNKIEAFRVAEHCRKSLILTMITTYGVKKNTYSGMVNSQVVLDDLFLPD